MIKDHVAEAVDLFQSGYNCSQAVLSVFSEELGITKDEAYSIAFPFGAGIGGYGKTCGALTGAIMVIGLKYKTSDILNIENKNICREKTRKLIESFESRHGTCNCSELVEFDMSKLSTAELKLKSQFFQNTCPKFIETVVSFLEEEL
ncbi:MAG: C-GCAxxG-C-C family protein [Bacteroidota bacterium]